MPAPTHTPDALYTHIVFYKFPKEVHLAFSGRHRQFCHIYVYFSHFDGDPFIHPFVSKACVRRVLLCIILLMIRNADELFFALYIHLLLCRYFYIERYSITGDGSTH